MVTGASFRLASDHRVETKPQAGQAHRTSLGAIIDYALPAVTNQQVRAIATLPKHFENTPAWGSPWHFHECDLQVALILRGSLDVAYEAGKTSRAAHGDILFIPGGVLHDVGGSSADYQVAEITFPGSFGTIESEAPKVGAATLGRTLAIRDAVLVGTRGGLAEYQYPIAAPHAERYAIRRYVRARTEAFDSQWRKHEDAYRMTFVTSGWKKIETADGQRACIGPMDIGIVPGGMDARDMEVSMDYEAVEVALLAG